MAKRAVITGITGQDGSYLAEVLLEQGYEVTGVVRRSSSPNLWRIEHILDRVTLRPADLVDHPEERELIEEVGRLERDAIEDVLDAPEVGRTRPPDGADDVVAFLEQQLREVRTVLPRNSCDDRALGHLGSINYIKGYNQCHG